MNSDGHRPVSEKYRLLSDLELKSAFNSIGFEPIVISGDQVERIEKIIKLYNLPTIVPAKEAVMLAEKRIQKNWENIAQKIIEQYSEPNLKEKISILTRY